METLTATTAVDLNTLFTSLTDVVRAFGLGAVEGLLALSAMLFAVTRFRPLVRFLAETPADWVVPAVQALSVLATGALTGSLIPPGGLEAALGGLVGALAPAWLLIRRAVQEFND